MNGRVSVLRFLRDVGCLYHASQDGECLAPIDLALKFNCLGAQAFLMATCDHPFVDRDSHCGVCKTFVHREGGPLFSPIPGFYNMTICDAILDNYLDERRQKEEERQRRRRLALEARAKKSQARDASGAGVSERNNSGVADRASVPKPVRREIEIEDVSRCAEKVVAELGISGEGKGEASVSERRRQNFRRATTPRCY